MTDRERLIELIDRAHNNPGWTIVECATGYGGDIDESLEGEADYLIANGVTFQKHGRWENIRFLTTGDGRMRVGDCSSCKSIERVTRCCPHCGARMEENKE